MLTEIINIKVITKASKTVESIDPWGFTHLFQLVVLQVSKPKPRERVAFVQGHTRSHLSKGAIHLRTRLLSQKELVLIPMLPLASYHPVEPENSLAHTGEAARRAYAALSTVPGPWQAPSKKWLPSRWHQVGSLARTHNELRSPCPTVFMGQHPRKEL